MLKIIGAMAVILSAMLLGMKKYNDIFERRRSLQEIFDGSIQVKNALRCICAPLHESFLCGGDFFRTASGKIKEGMLPEEAIKDTAYAIRVLKKEDLNIIERFAAGLSAQDLEGQIANIELFTKLLETEIKDATDELNSRGKLYVKGSVLTAAAVVLLLI